MDNKLLEIYSYLNRSYVNYNNLCNNLKDYINNKFDTDIIDDVLYQPSDGFIFLWNGILNTPINIEDVSRLNSIEELEQYLYSNSI